MSRFGLHLHRDDEEQDRVERGGERDDVLAGLEVREDREQDRPDDAAPPERARVLDQAGRGQGEGDQDPAERGERDPDREQEVTLGV